MRTEWVKIYEVLGTKFIKRWPISDSYHFITMCIMYHIIKKEKTPFFKKQELNYILLQHFLILKLLIFYPYLLTLSFQTDLALVGKPTPRLVNMRPCVPTTFWDPPASSSASSVSVSPQLSWFPKSCCGSLCGPASPPGFSCPPSEKGQETNNI